jgi:hypothetical protein
MKFFISLLIALSLGISSKAQQYDLRLNLTKGQHFTQSMIMNLNMAQSIAGQDVSIASAIQFDFDQTVKSITKNGDFVIESEYSHIIIDVDLMGQKMFYDSKGKDSSASDLTNTYATVFGKIIGKKFTVTISPKGKVTEVKGLKEIMASAAKVSSDPAAQKLIGETFDEKKLISNYESSYKIFPDNPVKVGDSWTQQRSVESIFPIELNAGYTLKEVNNGIAKIIATGDFNVKNDDVETNGIKMKTDLTGNYDGVYQMDINTGISNTAAISMPVKGTMEVMGLEFPVTVNTSMQTTTTQIN